MWHHFWDYEIVDILKHGIVIRQCPKLCPNDIKLKSEISLYKMLFTFLEYNKSLTLDTAGVFLLATPQRTQMITRHIQIYTCKHLQIVFITYTLHIHIYPHTHFIGIAQKEIWNERHCKEYKNTFIMSYCMIFFVLRIIDGYALRC